MPIQLPLASASGKRVLYFQSLKVELGKKMWHSTGTPVRWVASPMERQSDTTADFFNEE